MSDTGLRTLSERLGPWLREPLEHLDAARRSGRLGHAWLIKGPAGIGKLNLVYVFAARVLAGGDVAMPAELDPGAAAQAMRDHRAPVDHHPDLHRVFPAPGKRTIAVEQIRALSETLSMRSYRGAAKVAIIEPAEAMTPAAANALLKTLEEPTAQTYLFLVTHQPDRLLPTIRSRCQGFAVGAPTEAAVAEWLGIGSLEDQVMQIAGRAPLHAAELLSSGKEQYLSTLEEQLHRISINKLDPREVAERWAKQDTELALEWLAGRLVRAIKLRAAERGDSTTVTPARADTLHNAWRALPPRALFERLETAERLLDRLGSGINVELALHALLLRFCLERGRS